MKAYAVSKNRRQNKPRRYTNSQDETRQGKAGPGRAGQGKTRHEQSQTVGHGSQPTATTPSYQLIQCKPRQTRLSVGRIPCPLRSSLTLDTPRDTAKSLHNICAAATRQKTIRNILEISMTKLSIASSGAFFRSKQTIHLVVHNE